MFQGIVNWLSCFDVAARREGGWWEKAGDGAPTSPPPFFFFFFLACEVSVIAAGEAE